MPRCDEHGHYESRCPDCAQAFGHADCEDTIAELRADVERLTRELREARSALRAYAPRCYGYACSRLATHGRDGFNRADDRHCAAHAIPSDIELHAPAIRAAEGET